MEATAQESGAVAACRGDMHGRGSSNPYRAKGCRTAMTAFWFCKVHFSFPPSSVVTLWMGLGTLRFGVRAWIAVPAWRLQ